MQYSQRDLRAADMLALIFVGLGIALIVFGVIGLASGKVDGVNADTKVVSPEPGSKPVAGFDGKKTARAKSVPSGVLPLVIGVVCLCLGIAVNLKVRQLKRTGGKEPSDYEGVPAP